MQAATFVHGALMEKVVEVANVSKSFKTYERASSGFLASFRRWYYTTQYAPTDRVANIISFTFCYYALHTSDNIPWYS